MPKDDILRAAAEGNVDGMHNMIRAGTVNTDDKNSIKALIIAADKGLLEVCKVLLEWGVSAGAVDASTKRQPLHAAVGSGHLEVVQALLQGGADPSEKDPDGRPPITIAVQSKRMDIVKALVQAGGPVPEGEAALGLASVVREANLEKQSNMFKHTAQTTEPCGNDLLAADTAVWKAQREHMRLVTLKEEQKAGNAIIELERQLASETSVYDEAKSSEASLARQLQDLRVVLQTTETAHGVSMQYLAAAEQYAREAAVEEAEADAEYKAMMQELSSAQSERDERERYFENQERRRDEELATAKELQAEVTAMIQRNREIEIELRAESADLRGWERDQEFAAQLTAQAQLLLSPKKANSKDKRLPEDELAEAESKQPPEA